ncbi:MAG: BCD family MFS transporter [Pseudomonadota bacterium]
MNLTRLSQRVFPSRALLAMMPYAPDSESEPSLGRIARLSLFQVSVGIAAVLLTGTLNRIMVLELQQPAWLVSVMVALPLFFAPLRVLIGFRSDNYRSLIGWRRVPYLWGGTLLQFGGLAIMPFALIVLTEPTTAPTWVGPGATALAFLLVGAGLHTTQTAGLALATDITSDHMRPNVVAMLYVMLLLGTIGSSLLISLLLADFDYLRLIKVIQGAAVVTIVLNVIALWRQESLNPNQTDPQRTRPSFREALARFMGERRARRLLLGIGLGTAAFNMQDILLEPYGGEVLGMSVSGTTGLSAVWATGMLAAFVTASRMQNQGSNPLRVAGAGLVIGLFAFAAVICAAPVNSASLFVCGAFLIGVGGGLFAVGTLSEAMDLGTEEEKGLALGTWGAVQATSAGIAIALGGAIKDAISYLAINGSLGPALDTVQAGYSTVYHIEILLLFAALVAIGPLVSGATAQNRGLQLQDFPT